MHLRLLFVFAYIILTVCVSVSHTTTYIHVVLSRLFIYLCGFELCHQSLHLCSIMDTQATIMVQPASFCVTLLLLVFSSKHTHTHPSHTNTAAAMHSYRMQCSHRPKMDPFTAKRGQCNYKHCTLPLSTVYTLTPHTSLHHCSFCLQMQSIKDYNSIWHSCFLLENCRTVSSSCFSIILKAVSIPRPMYRHVRSFGLHVFWVECLLLLAVWC